MITYLKGDVTSPQLEPGEIGVIVHSCNDIGKWGAGFVLALNKRWSKPRESFLAWKNPQGGEFQTIQVEPNLYVINLIGQSGIRGPDNEKPVRYEWLETGMKDIAAKLPDNASVHMPRIGCGLGGGDWATIATIIDNTFGRYGIPVYVYDL